MKIFFILLFMLFVTATGALSDDRLLVQSAKERIRLSGYTRSHTVITVSSEVSGKVLEVNYDVGQSIGEKPFYEIDPTFIDFQIRSTQQSLQKLGAALLKNSSAVKYLEKEFRRIEQLHKGDRATEVRRDAAEEELKQARLERKTLQAENAILENALNELKERKRRHSIYAPKGWIVTRKMVEAGELVSQQTPMAEVGNFQQLVVPLSVSGRELEVIRNFPEIFEARLEGEAVKAGINWVNPEFDEKTRKLSIELMLKDYAGEKRGGLRFSLDMDMETEGLRIPKDAVINRYENPRVTLKENGESINIMVLGESDGNLIVAEDPKLEIGKELERVQ